MYVSHRREKNHNHISLTGKDNDTFQYIRLFYLTSCFFPLLIFIGCGTRLYIPENTLSEYVMEYIQEHDSYSARASDVFPFSWEELWIITPYTDPDALDLPRRIRFTLHRSGIQDQDAFVVLLFLCKDNLYRVYTESRYPVDFLPSDYSGDKVIFHQTDLLCFSPYSLYADERLSGYILQIEEDAV